MIRHTQERVDRLRGYLQVIAAEAFVSRADAEPGRLKAHDVAIHATEQPSPSPLDRACGAACSLCKGDCCLTGEERLAYLTADTLRSWRRQRPDVTADDIVAEYLSFVSGKSTGGGCFYQAGTGCTLPRDMRSEVCNRYFCDELRQFRAAAESLAEAEAQRVDDEGRPASVRAFFVVTLPNGRRQTRFHETPFE